MRSQLCVLTLASTLLIPPMSLLQAKNRAPIDPKRQIRLVYGYPQWNTDSTRIDKASILVQDSKSGRLVQIQLEETEPDSGVFSGHFNIAWAEGGNVSPKVYIPPQNLMKSKEGIRQLREKLARKDLKRKPFVVHKDPSGLQIMEVFDTKSQAKQAYKAIKKKRQTMRQEKIGKTREREDAVSKAAAAKALVDAATLAKEEAEKKRLAKEAAAHNLERTRLEQVARQQKLAKQKQMERFNKAEQAQRKSKAKKLAGQAMVAYRKQDYKTADKLFSESLSLDPTNDKIYYQYAVTLYKQEKFNKSLVYLNLSSGPSVNKTEKEYYTALNYFRLKEHTPALIHFRKVKATKHEVMSPSAAFYEGIILFQNREYDQAQPAFQFVLDTSKDPKLDERAESYIERILSIKAFLLKKSKRWSLSVGETLGYDSNIILASDSNIDQGTATNEKGYRTITSLGLGYRAILEKTHELTPSFDFVYYYSLNDKFKTAEAIERADPMVMTLGVPFTYKGKMFKKGYKLKVKPSYEDTHMSIEGSSKSRKSILKSTKLALDQTWVLMQQYFLSLKLEYRIDKSELSTSVGADDSSTNKTSIVVNNIYFFDDKNSKGLIGDLGYRINAAKGDNNKFNRTEIDLTYTQPVFWELTASAGIGYHMINYTKIDRDDTKTSFSGGLSKKLNDWLSSSLSLTQESQDSKKDGAKNDSNTYKKTTVMLGFTGSWDF